MKNLYEHVDALANADPARPAILVCDITGAITEEISRSELLTRVCEAVAYLQSTGMRVGDRVALEFGNCADLLILSWAAWSMGVVTVPLDLKRDTNELRDYKIKASGAKLLISQKEFLKTDSTSGELSWMPNLSHEALILFTSGTTARPKGADLTLENLVANAEGIMEWLHMGEDDRFLVQLPLHHINSTTFCLASLLAGASIALPPAYSNSHFWEQAAGSGATLTSVVPSIIFDQLARHAEFDAVKNRLKLRRIQLGSAPVVVSDTLEFMQKFSVPLYQGYGQTETALRVTGVPMDLSKEQHEKAVSENSIGTPMPWAHVEIADAGGRILGEKQEGELIVKGPAVMRGYVGGEPAFRDGYFLTGDIGYWKELMERRFFFLKGRAKELIIKGGVNISPVAVENALKRLSIDIEQAYVIGVYDVRYGEEVGTVIVWKDGIDLECALRRLKLVLLSEHDVLSAYETPKYLTAVRAEDLPMTSTGKVQRTILKRNLADKMGSLYELFRSEEYRFIVISPQSPLTEQSRILYNHCWQPLVKNAREYKKYLDDYLTLGAVDKNGALAGQISFSYNDDVFCCVSICSASFKPKLVPEIKDIPNQEFVQQYLLTGHDPVMNFHRTLGAELVEVIPHGRPEDKSALGYTMLVRYPPVGTEELSGPVSHQLIQAIRIWARDVRAEVTALSRPGGLASYLYRSA